MGGECDDEGIQLGFQNQAEMNTIPITVDSFYHSRASFGCVLQDNVLQGSNSNSSQMENYPLGVNFDEIFLPKISMLESGSILQEDVEVGLNGKRKRNLKLSPSHEVPEKDQHDHSSKTFEKNEVGILSATQTSKQQHKHQDEEARKQNYVHVRAKRGQATNSHSIAERARREKISERMRLLQELVPGCNKITGKAVMLDEIINYVQSLQHQVEFLSMKLAAASPDPNFDINNEVPPKEILHSRGNDPSFTGFNQAMSSSYGLNHGNLTTMPNALAQYHHLSQAVWDGDVQNLLHMDFDPSPVVSNLGPNGMSKTEQL